MARNRNRKAGQKKKVQGKGDYQINNQQDLVNAITDIDKRLTRMDSKIPKQPSTSVGKAAGTLGRLAGGFLGNSELGGQAAEALSNWFGYGDYTINHNSLVKGDPELGLHFDKDGRRGIRITEREYIGDVVSGPTLTAGATDFHSTTYRINPGASETFPWLSKMAPLFDQWKPNGIIFEFKSTSSAYNGTSQALGVVGAATDYDVLDPPYATKIEAEQADYSNSCKAAEDLLHGIECEARERPDGLYFVRNGPVDPLADNARFYDLGNFQLFTKGMSQAGVVLGELWVSYDVTFYKKQLNSGSGAAYIYVELAGITGSSNIFGTSQTLWTNTTARITADGTISLGSDFRPGDYFLVQFETFANAYGITIGGTGQTNPTSGYYDPDSANPGQYIMNASGTNGSYERQLRYVTDLNPTITFTSGGATASSGGITIIKLPRKPMYLAQSSAF